MSSFKEKVIEIVGMIPEGNVVSYGQVALMTGVPRGARQVGWTLNQIDKSQVDSLPWWRVINNEGRISIKSPDHSPLIQKQRLEKDGVCVSDDLNVDIEKYRWKPNQDILNRLQLKDKYSFALHQRF